MKVISSKPKYNPDLDMHYWHTKAEHDGHLIEVTSDDRGHHLRIDGGRIVPKLDELGVLRLIYSLFGKGGAGKR